MGKRKRELEGLTEQVKSLQENMKALLEEKQPQSKKLRTEQEDKEEDNSAGEYGSSSNSDSEAEDGKSNSAETEHSENKENDSKSTHEIDSKNPITQNQVENVELTEETPLDDEVAQILGEDPSASKALKLKLHSTIQKKWKFWYENGMKKEDKENLLEKYQSPTGLEALKLNPEILLRLPKHSKTRDLNMYKRQELTGAALTSIGAAMTDLIEENVSIDKNDFMQRLHDAAKLMVEVLSSETKSRIASIAAGVDKETKAILDDTKPTEYLFGKNLSEKFKEAKLIDKVANSIKRPLSFKNQAIASKQPLNQLGLQGKRPFLNQAGTSHQGYQYPSGQAKQKLFFRTKQPFNSRAQYQGYNKVKNQTRFK